MGKPDIYIDIPNLRQLVEHFDALERESINTHIKAIYHKILECFGEDAKTASVRFLLSKTNGYPSEWVGMFLGLRNMRVLDESYQIITKD